jgi:hypothetical protein
MFLNADILNEGAITANKTKSINPGHSEGKNPKSFLVETKLSDCSSTKSQSCVNSNWQKLRG